MNTNEPTEGFNMFAGRWGLHSSIARDGVATPQNGSYWYWYELLVATGRPPGLPSPHRGRTPGDTDDPEHRRFSRLPQTRPRAAATRVARADARAPTATTAVWSHRENAFITTANAAAAARTCAGVTSRHPPVNPAARYLQWGSVDIDVQRVNKQASFAVSQMHFTGGWRGRAALAHWRAHPSR